MTKQGIYYANGTSGLEMVTVKLFNPDTGKSQEVGRSDRRLASVRGLTVSPDGSTILVAANERWGSDLMMVENFK